MTFLGATPNFLLGNLWRTAALVLAIAAGTQSLRLDSAQQELAVQVATAEADKAKVAADIARQREAFEAAARAIENRQRAALDAVAKIYEQEKDDAVAKERAVVADLRAGNLRLRQHWRDFIATAELSAAAGAAAVVDGGTGLREQGAAALVRVGADADAHVRGLQAALSVCAAADGP